VRYRIDACRGAGGVGRWRHFIAASGSWEGERVRSATAGEEQINGREGARQGGVSIEKSANSCMVDVIWVLGLCDGIRHRATGSPLHVSSKMRCRSRTSISCRLGGSRVSPVGKYSLQAPLMKSRGRLPALAEPPNAVAPSGRRCKSIRCCTSAAAQGRPDEPGARCSGFTIHPRPEPLSARKKHAPARLPAITRTASFLRSFEAARHDGRLLRGVRGPIRSRRPSRRRKCTLLSRCDPSTSLPRRSGAS
jgi:hypothetical protein